MSQIRADFTNCALPANSLSEQCITGAQNEPDNCGFSTSLQGLCAYCATSSPNATDSCCVESKVTSRCSGVTLPPVFSMPPIFTSSTSSPMPSATNGTAAGGAQGTSNNHSGLSGGAIAGIVVGSILGAALVFAILIGCCFFFRRRQRNTSRASVFNQPSPPRQTQPQMAYSNASRGLGPVVPGGRVARMSALEGTSSDDPQVINPVIAAERRRYGDTSDSDIYGDSPESRGGGAPPVTGKRNGSLSSNSVFGALDDRSPNSGTEGQFSSPDGIASGQSEQLSSFKDYYSQDEIHPNDKVATLWAYQPRAGDEFELERGDMLKVVGIWDDGWATGVRISDRAEDYDDNKYKALRDSGVSGGTGRREPSPISGEIKAFPVSLDDLHLIVPDADPIIACLRMLAPALEENRRRRQPDRQWLSRSAKQPPISLHY